MLWLDAIRGEPVIYEDLKAWLTDRQNKVKSALTSSQTWEKTLQLQGEVRAYNDLLNTVTADEKKVRHEAERVEMQHRETVGR